MDGGAASSGQRHQPQQGQSHGSSIHVLRLTEGILSCRTAQSLTWSSSTLWTSGWRRQRQRSVSLSRSYITPARPTGRGRQGVWSRWADGEKRAKALTKGAGVLATPLYPDLCRPDGRATFLPNKPSSSTASRNSQEVK